MPVSLSGPRYDKKLAGLSKDSMPAVQVRDRASEGTGVDSSNDANLGVDFAPGKLQQKPYYRGHINSL